MKHLFFMGIKMTSYWNHKVWDRSSPSKIASINGDMIAEVMKAAKISEEHPGSRVQGIITGNIGHGIAQMVAWSLARSGDVELFHTFCEKYVDFEARDLCAFFGDHQTPSQLRLTMDVIKTKDISADKFAQVMRQLNREAIEEIYALGLWENITALGDTLSDETEDFAPFSSDLKDFFIQQGGTLTDVIIHNPDIMLEYSKEGVPIEILDREGLINYFVEGLDRPDLYEEALNLLGTDADDGEFFLMELLADKINDLPLSVVKSKLFFCYDKGCLTGDTSEMIRHQMSIGEIVDDELSEFAAKIA